MTFFSFFLFLTMFVLVGLAAVRRSRGNRRDYYMASHSVKPWLVGLSAIATNLSGYMFIGVIGYTYVEGLSSIWLMFGWIVGDLIASMLIHRPIRQAAEKTGQASYLGLLSSWGGTRYRAFQCLTALISLIFLLAYAAAQLMAGSKALHVLFDWPMWGGAVMGSLLVVAYCFAGGIRASIWTDAAQSFVMVFAMGALLLVAVDAVGGYEMMISKMSEIPGFLNWFPSELPVPGITGSLLFALGWLFAGLSVAGQPHIMIRFMTLDEPGKMMQVRLWYYSWFTVFYAMATAVGMLSRIYLDDPGSFDAELALPMMAQQLFPPALVGLVLAGIFAATLSTADSLILSCSSTLTHDLLPRRIEKIILLKLSTIVMTAIALALALGNWQSVFALVIMAWSGLASSFVPLLLVWVLGGRPGEKLAISMALFGLTVALLWRWAELHHAIYEGAPGILAGLALYCVVRLAKRVAAR